MTTTRTIAFDTETWLAAPGREAPPLVCLSTYDGVENKLYDAVGGLAWFRQVIADPTVTLVNQNIAYDLAVLAAADESLIPLIFGAYEAGRIGCTMVRQMMLEIMLGEMSDRSRYNLGHLVEKWLGETVEGKAATEEGEEDPWRYRYRELSTTPIDAWPLEAREYAKLDAKYAWRVWMKQESQPLPDLEPQFRAAFALYLLKCWGIRTDRVLIDALEAQLHLNVDEKVERLTDLGIYRWEGTKKEPRRKRVKNTRVVKARVLAALGPAAPLTDGGAQKRGQDPARATALPVDWAALKAAPDALAYLQGLAVVQQPIRPDVALKRVNDFVDDIQTDEEALLASRDPVLLLLAEVGGDQKLLNTYLPLLRQGVDLPIHPWWNVLVNSGRTSARAPNLQNQPRKPGVRECFVPRPGWVFCSADYHTAELRSLAQVLLDAYGHSEMAAALLAKKDLHVVTGAAILGEPYEKVYAWFKGSDPVLKKKAKDARQLAKAANFGFPGGLGAARFVEYAAGPDYQIVMTEDEAKSLKETWLNTYPEMRRFFADIGEQCNLHGGSFLLEQPRSGRLRGDVLFTAACNSVFQGLTADGAKAALWAVVRECYDPTVRTEDGAPGAGQPSPLYGCRVVAFIHDELFLEMPEGTAAEAAARVEHVMSREMRRYTPDIPAPVEAALMRRWSKAAGDAVRDASGRLIPWEDSDAFREYLKTLDKAGTRWLVPLLGRTAV